MYKRQGLYEHIPEAFSGAPQSLLDRLQSQETSAVPGATALTPPSEVSRRSMPEVGRTGLIMGESDRRQRYEEPATGLSVQEATPADPVATSRRADDFISKMESMGISEEMWMQVLRHPQAPAQFNMTPDELEAVMQEVARLTGIEMPS